MPLVFFFFFPFFPILFFLEIMIFTIYARRADHGTLLFDRKKPEIKICSQ